MAKIATVRLLINADDEAQIADGLNEALREITQPCGSGRAVDSCILDYQFRHLTAHVDAAVEATIAAGNYAEGTAFTSAALASDNLYLVVCSSEGESFARGPFVNDEDLRAEVGALSDFDPANLLRLSLADDGAPTVHHMHEWLAMDNDRLFEAVIHQLGQGLQPIARAKGTENFFVFFEGDEVLFTHDMLKQLENEFNEMMVVESLPTRDAVVTLAAAARRYSEHDWKQAVLKGETTEGYLSWRWGKAQQLPKAQDLFKEANN